MIRVRFQTVALIPLAGALLVSVTLIGESDARASTPTSAAAAAAAYNHALSDALAKKYVVVESASTATNFRGVATFLSGPTFAKETATLTYSGPPFKFVEIVVGKSLYMTGTAAALTDNLNFSKTNASKYENEPLLLPPTNSLYSSTIDGTTTPSGLASIRMKGTVTEGKSITYKGQLVNVYSGNSVEMPGSPSIHETVYVSTTGDPVPVLVKGKSNGLNITDSFSNWGVAFKVVAPTHAITIQPSWTKLP